MAPIAARRQSTAGSQATLALPRPQLPGNNLHVCVLNPAGLVPRQGAFTNPQVDDLQCFGLLSLAELKRKHAPFFCASRTKGARNSSSQVRMPAPGAALPSARSIRPTIPQAPAAPSPPHSQAPATSCPSRPSACRPWPQCPRHLRIPYRRTPVTHRLPHSAPPCTRGFPRNCMQCNLVPHSFQPSAPSAYDIQPTAPQAPATFGPPPPKRLQHPAHRLPHNARPCTRGFPRSCLRCNLVPHGFPHSAPGICGMLNAMLPRSCDSPRSTPSARYLFGTTLSSNQVHRNAKATRTRVPPA